MTAVAAGLLPAAGFLHWDLPRTGDLVLGLAGLAGLALALGGTGSPGRPPPAGWSGSRWAAHPGRWAGGWSGTPRWRAGDAEDRRSWRALGRRLPGGPSRAMARTSRAARSGVGRSGVGRSGVGRAGAARPEGARWAGRRDLRPLERRGGERDRLVLGRSIGRGIRRGAVLATERTQSLCVVGPTQSGKTSALAVPAILGWEGPVLAASVKTDLLRDTLAWRRRCGRVWCFDPAGSTGMVGDRWSPLLRSTTWAGARRAAGDLCNGARSEGTTADGEFWYATAAKLLAPLLLAAATGGRTMTDVVRWVDTQDTEEVLDLLERAGVPEALDAAAASWQRDERQRSSVYTTAETVLEPFAEPDTGAGGGEVIDAGRLLDGEHTLYVCAPAHDQRRLRGLFAAVVHEVVERAFERSARSGRRLDPPLLIVLDEAANIAPLAELDGLAATCAGHGVQLVTVWQDLAQVTARYGPRAATVVNNHRAKVFLSGIADPATLDHASHLVGTEELLVPSLTRDATGTRSTTMAPQQRALLPPDALRRLGPGTGVLVYGSLPPVQLRLRPWWDDPELARRAGVTDSAPDGAPVGARTGAAASRRGRRR